MWLSQVDDESNCSMNILRADTSGEFISAKLKSFYKKRGILIKYAALYMHEENRLAERRWKIIVIIKDSMLIDSGLPNHFWVEILEIVNYLRNKL